MLAQTTRALGCLSVQPDHVTGTRIIIAPEAPLGKANGDKRTVSQGCPVQRRRWAGALIATLEASNFQPLFGIVPIPNNGRLL